MRRTIDLGSVEARRRRTALLLVLGGIAVYFYTTLVAAHYPSPWSAAHVPALMVALPFLAVVVYRKRNRLGMRPVTGAVVAGVIVLAAVLYPLLRF